MLDRDDADGALQLGVRAMACAKSASDLFVRACASELCGMSLARQGSPASSRRFFSAAARTFHTLGHQRRLAQCKVRWAAAERRAGDLDAAVELLEAAYGLADGSRSINGQAVAGHLDLAALASL